MSSMFDGCTSLYNLSGLSNWNVSSATDLSYMFRSCTSLESLSGIFNNVSSVKNMSCMFYGCTSLSDLSGLSTWALTSVTNMDSMFYNCSALVIAHLDEWNPSNNVITYYMFSGCSQLEIIYCKYSWKTCSDASYSNRKWYYYPMFADCILLHSESSGKKYVQPQLGQSQYADPISGYFTMPTLGSFIPTIQKTVLDENNQPMTDWSFESGQFSFIISSVNPGTPLPEQTEIETDDNGQSIWSEIKYYDPGEYIYKVVEKQGNIPGMTYDTAPHELKVTIKDE